MKKGLVYSVSALVVIALIAFKLKSNEHENAERAAIVKDGSSGAVPVLVSKVARHKI